MSRIGVCFSIVTAPGTVERAPGRGSGFAGAVDCACSAVPTTDALAAAAPRLATRSSHSRRVSNAPCGVISEALGCANRLALGTSMTTPGKVEAALPGIPGTARHFGAPRRETVGLRIAGDFAAQAPHRAGPASAGHFADKTLARQRSCPGRWPRVGDTGQVPRYQPADPVIDCSHESASSWALLSVEFARRLIDDRVRIAAMQEQEASVSARRCRPIRLHGAFRAMRRTHFVSAGRPCSRPRP
jgi:hypothetical protein